MDLDFTIIETSGLSQTEFAVLVGANRLTVNNWCNDRAEPHSIFRARCRKTLELLQHAIDTNVLPGEIPPATGGTMPERRSFIKHAIRTVAKDLRGSKSPQAEDSST